MDDRPVLLFYWDFGQRRPLSTVGRATRSWRRGARRLLNHRTVMGFEMSTRMLICSLQSAGRRVYVNDYERARQAPDYPVGITGHSQILDRWSLPNPAVLGPGLLDHPAIKPSLMDDDRFRRYIVTCGWMEELFRPYYGSSVVRWFAGIDTRSWPDASGLVKRYDCLIYDKIQWDRDRLVPDLLRPVQMELTRSGLSYAVLRYGDHKQATYRKLLARSRFMVFLSEHETQGLAYQEAMASNLPVLAWDPGFWVDPNRLKYTSNPVHACSVPYFNDECGATFCRPEQFDSALEAFVRRLDSFRPRQFVQQHLSFHSSAETYLRHYDALAGSEVRPGHDRICRDRLSET
jgi:hypothetical protein